MDNETFDSLAREIAGGLNSRRAAVRLLAGATFGVPVAWNTLHEGADAQKKRRLRRSDRKVPGELQAAGKKHKKKGKRKEKKRNRDEPEVPPLPPGCQNCNECEMCQDNACVPDGELDGVHCGDPADPGGECRVCRNGSCAFKCHYEDSICCKGECLLPCDVTQRINLETCQCEDAICEGPTPNCGVCAAPKCTASGWVCHKFMGDGQDCGKSTICCAAGHPLYSCRGGYCCLEVSEGVFHCV